MLLYTELTAAVHFLPRSTACCCDNTRHLCLNAEAAAAGQRQLIVRLAGLMQKTIGHDYVSGGGCFTFSQSINLRPGRVGKSKIFVADLGQYMSISQNIFNHCHLGGRGGGTNIAIEPSKPPVDTRHGLSLI